MTAPQRDAYLQRIGLDAPPAPSLAGLRALQTTHITTVPFENLDVFLRRPLRLDPDGLFDKIVTERRGGYCFELNQLYADLLRALGFEVTRLLARVWSAGATEAPPRTHLVHYVRLDGRRWLTEVGFGGSAPRHPLDLDLRDEQPDQDGSLWVLPDERFGFRLERALEEGRRTLYSFDESHVADTDIASGNFWTEQHPTSHFRGKVAAVRFHESGRDNLIDATFTEQRDATETKEDVVDVDAWLAAVRERFGLTLTLSDVERQRLATHLRDRV